MVPTNVCDTLNPENVPGLPKHLCTKPCESLKCMRDLMSHRRYQTCGFVGARNFLGLTAHARTPCKTYERMRPGNQTNHTRRSRRPGMGANVKGPRAKRTIGEEAPKGLAKGRLGQRIAQKAA